MEAHPLADLFPMMSEEEFARFADDVADRGQREPIVVFDGKILDGRNRFKACEKWGLVPETVAFTGDDPLGFVLSKNLHRRHLTESQRAMVAAGLVDWENGINQHSGGSANLPTREAGKRLSISERAVRAAKRIRERGTDELVAAIRDGRLSVHAGEAISDLKREAQAEVLRQEEKAIVQRAKAIRAERQKLRHTVRLAQMAHVSESGAAAAGKVAMAYPVIYADPPWRFGVRSEVTGREKSAENHYPTMATADIRALFGEIGPGPSGPAKRDAVLFLWATNPMLPDGLSVMEAWGFSYVHHWVWDKEEAGTGYWGRDRHELLLIGRRGDVAAPLPGSQPETVHRERKGRHSAKPDFFAETIERLYPDMPRLELFCRRPRPGWDAWGFEAGDDGPHGRAAPDGAGLRTARPTTGDGRSALPPAAEGKDRASVSREELDEWKALGAIEAGVMVAGGMIVKLAEADLIQPKGDTGSRLTAKGKERMAALEAAVSAASDGDAVNVRRAG